MTYDPSRFQQPNPALHDSIERKILAADLASLLTWLRRTAPERWDGVSSAMSLLTGRSLEDQLWTICSGVISLPSRELTVLAGLFRDVGADIAAGRGHRPLSVDESAALESLRDVLATV